MRESNSGGIRDGDHERDFQRLGLLTTIATRQLEDRAIVRTRQAAVQPLQKVALAAEDRHSVVIDRSQYGRTDQNLAARVTLAFGLTDAGGETDTLGPQSRQAFIECLNSCVALRCL